MGSFAFAFEAVRAGAHDRMGAGAPSPGMQRFLTCVVPDRIGRQKKSGLLPSASFGEAMQLLPGDRRMGGSCLKRGRTWRTRGVLSQTAGRTTSMRTISARKVQEDVAARTRRAALREVLQRTESGSRRADASDCSCRSSRVRFLTAIRREPSERRAPLVWDQRPMAGFEQPGLPERADLRRRRG